MSVIEDGEEKDEGWLKVAKDCFTSSTDYFDANWRKNIERNIALFQSKHPTGSKYNSAAYKSRSRLFRPKIKSAVRKNEAAAAAAFFSNMDVVNIAAENDADPAQQVSAEVMNEVVNYRLTKSVPWFQILVGAIQEAQVVGDVASYQYWDYREDNNKVLVDKPCIKLIPIENIRFDPGSDWTDPINSSPYVIRMVPMYVDDVRQMMNASNPKTGQTKWIHHSDEEIRSAMVLYDTIRMQRETNKQDPLASDTTNLKDFDIVWCHENFVRLGGHEVVYWTLGTEKMLSDPVLLSDAYFHGERPIVLGYAALEAHRVMPDSLVGMGAELQKEANETVNQRRDNVSLVLNKRYIVKRNAQVDIDSLMKNVAGGATMANDPETDVREMNWPDVTSSAYREQDLLNVDLDELMGNFSQSSVQTNRQLNETVGGMKMVSGAAGQMTDYLLMTFVHTWVEKVLAQLVKLEQAYETDATILTLCGQKSELVQKYGIDPTTDGILNGSLTIKVSIGGATDPQAKLGKFMGALKAYGEAMQLIPDADPEAVRKEVFGLLGYKDGQRFFKPAEDPQIMKMKQDMQQMQQMLQEMQQKVQEAALKLQSKDEENRIKAFEAETHRAQAMKPDAPQAAPQDDTRKLELDFLNSERERMFKYQIEQMKAEIAERNKVMELSAGIIEAEIAPAGGVGPDGQPVEAKTVAQTLEGMMATIQDLAQQVEDKLHEKRELLRDGNGVATHVIKNGVPHQIIRDMNGKASSVSDTPDYSLMDQQNEPNIDDSTAPSAEV